MASAGGDDDDKHKQKTDALFNKIVTSAKKKIEETEKVGGNLCLLWCCQEWQRAVASRSRQTGQPCALGGFYARPWGMSHVTDDESRSPHLADKAQEFAAKAAKGGRVARRNVRLLPRCASQSASRDASSFITAMLRVAIFPTGSALS